jgi:hypothetical protein
MSLNREHCLVFAFRYALNRKTTAPGIVADELTLCWARLRPHTREQIKKEIREQMKQDPTGEYTWNHQWRRVLELK